jgi:hypothetical protein
MDTITRAAEATISDEPTDSGIRSIMTRRKGQTTGERTRGAETPNVSPTTPAGGSDRDQTARFNRALRRAVPVRIRQLGRRLRKEEFSRLAAAVAKQCHLKRQDGTWIKKPQNPGPPSRQEFDTLKFMLEFQSDKIRNLEREISDLKFREELRIPSRCKNAKEYAATHAISTFCLDLYKSTSFPKSSSKHVSMDRYPQPALLVASWLGISPFGLNAQVAQDYYGCYNPPQIQLHFSCDSCFAKRLDFVFEFEHGLYTHLERLDKSVFGMPGFDLLKVDEFWDHYSKGKGLQSCDLYGKDLKLLTKHQL